MADAKTNEGAVTLARELQHRLEQQGIRSTLVDDTTLHADSGGALFEITVRPLPAPAVG